MYPKLLHIYGPFFVQSYGVCIALGLVLYTWLLFKDPIRKKLVTDDQFHTLLLAGVLSALLGGRILYFLTEEPLGSLREFFEVWTGGFAVLGSVLGVLVVLSYLLKSYKLPVLLSLDRAALYGPLLQGISRIGCFLAGCCYGKITNVSWAITYTDRDCLAPLHVGLHPTQLYSACSLFLIFFLLIYAQRVLKKDGQLFLLYLSCMSFERFFNDFLRADRSFFGNFIYSNHQLIALAIGIISITCLVFRSRKAVGAHGL